MLGCFLDARANSFLIPAWSGSNNRSCFEYTGLKNDQAVRVREGELK